MITVGRVPSERADMRRSMVLAAILALAGRGLAGQHAGQWEAGAFSSYTRYDPSFGLAQRPGGGIRLGYLVGDLVGVEGDLLFQPEYTVTPISGTPVTLQPLIGSASLVLNAVHARRLMVYALGGYTLLDFGTRAPYRFTDNAAHGGAGVRLFLTERVALRLEGRAIYTVGTKSTFSSNPKHYVATLGLSVFHLGGPPKDSDHDGVPDDRTSAPTPRAAPPSTRTAARWTPITTACRTASTSVPTRRSAPRSTPRAAPSTPMATARPTASINAPTRRRALWWTRRAAPSTPMATACPTASTSAPTHHRGRRSTRSVVRCRSRR